MNATPSDSTDANTASHVANAATVDGMPQKRGLLTDAEKRKIDTAAKGRDIADAAYRAAIVAAAKRGASVRELAAFTGLSTNTISRWKRDAS